MYLCLCFIDIKQRKDISLGTLSFFVLNFTIIFFYNDFLAIVRLNLLLLFGVSGRRTPDPSASYLRRYFCESLRWSRHLSLVSPPDLGLSPGWLVWRKDRPSVGGEWAQLRSRGGLLDGEGYGRVRQGMSLGQTARLLGFESEDVNQATKIGQDELDLFYGLCTLT